MRIVCVRARVRMCVCGDGCFPDLAGFRHHWLGRLASLISDRIAGYDPKSTYAGKDGNADFGGRPTRTLSKVVLSGAIGM